MSKLKYILILFYMKSSFADPAKDDFPRWVVNGIDNLNAIVFNTNQFLSYDGALSFNSYYVNVKNIKNMDLKISYKKMSGCGFSSGEDIPDSNIFLLVNGKEFREYQYISLADFNLGDDGAEISIRIKGLNINHYGTFSCKINAALVINN
ncbi:hypothetical protein [Fluviispira sanaruensis]|uniref:Uncharacterized protein n=1 Tax=Fluviispira sanaruensis TaxID=2493639 RepID=A0A4P2VV53_FLUSA|nr:hypothetical protein [Fluviispira sanaruensis]BBH52782.1 hypothetical protein JCM31447_12250 [Fluviispira sanaruensis]